MDGAAEHATHVHSQNHLSHCGCRIPRMDIVERMTASPPAPLGWKAESAVEWGQRICNGVSSHFAELGQKYEALKTDLR